MAAEASKPRPASGAPPPMASPNTLELDSTTENMKLAVASFSLVGAGCSAGYYLAPAGYFEQNFQDSNFLLWMLMVLYLPFPAMLLLQEKFDEHFDAMFGPRQTYFFRIIAVQMILAASFACYSHSSKSPTAVLVCGAFIGSFGAATLSSTMQLMAAWEPHLSAWACVGKDVGGALPVITYFACAFSPSTATTADFASMQLFPIILICLCTVCLTGLHSSGIWDKAYARLGYDLWDAENEECQRQVSEADPLYASEVDNSGAPLWIPKWQFASGSSCFVSFILMPLVTFLHNPDLTQKLVLAKLAMDFSARMVAALIARTDAFGMTKPSHYLLAAQMALRTVLFVPLLTHVLGYFALHANIFAFAWLVFYFFGSFAATQIDVTIVRFAPVALRKAISRRNVFANYVGVGGGLALDAAFLVFA